MATGLRRGLDMKPSPASVAHHEASHAVYWWWWVNQPGGYDDYTHGGFEYIELTPDHGEHLGQFDPGGGVANIGDRRASEHFCGMALAGPVSDEMRGERTNQRIDLRMARAWARQFLGDEGDEPYLATIRADVRAFLQRSEVVAMVEGLASALVDRGGLSFEEATEIMSSARPN